MRIRGRRSPLLAVLVCALLGVIALLACRKPPPEEAVYTGARKNTPGGAPTTPGGGSTTSSGGPGTFDKRALLRSVSACALDRYRGFYGTAQTLREAARGYASSRTDETRENLKKAWLAAMASWEEAELFRVGPAASSVHPGGADLRDQIYPWPLVNRCKIEEQLVSRTYETPAFATSLVSARGLAAIEYLIFYGGSDNVCAPQSAINVQGTWAALAPNELAQRKAEYARAAAEDVVVHAGSLVAAWDPALGNFGTALSEPGSPKSPFALDRDALNSVSDAIFYVEREVKDLKLARPLGFSVDCPSARCPEAVESPYAGASNAHLRANFVGFRRIFEGCGENGAGLGFDDWLRAAGAGSLADRMLAALANARAALDALELPLEQAIVSSPAKADALYAAVKALTDLLKAEFVTVLDLELPATSEGDND